jgi:NAD(P)-dependent dehydrogenase (short-subunit alcohol dehydrogenase family)
MAHLFDERSILLTDRVAIVTGAAEGIGRDTALLFARCGATLAICDRQEELLADVAAQIEALGRPVISAVLDVRDAVAVDAFVESIASAHGHVDVLVNNAGGTFVSPFLDVSPKGEASLIAENFTQATHFIRRVAPLMTNGGSIINITSIEAHQAGPGFGIYAAMKTALESLSKSLALEFGTRRIRVNSISPGYVLTDLTKAIIDKDPSLQDDWIARIPQGRMATPSDLSGLVSFLASDASAYLTAQDIMIDGGYTAV